MICYTLTLIAQELGLQDLKEFFFFLQSFQFAQDIFLFTDRKTRSPSVFFPWISRKGKKKAYKTWFIQNNIYIEGESYPSDCDFVWIQCWTPDFVAHHVKWMYDLYHGWWGGRLFLVYQLFARTLLKSFILINIFSLTFSSWLKLAIT